MLLKIAVLPGDGVGPEVTAEAMRVLEAAALAFGHGLDLSFKEIGGSAIKRFGVPLPDETLEACLASSAVLMGAVGDPAFDAFPLEARPESALLGLRRELGAFANLRPAVAFQSLLGSSPLRRSIVEGTDVLIVRELLGGLYFGEPRGASSGECSPEAFNTMRYNAGEIERVAVMAFELARARRSKVTSVDKANVLECSRLWRQTVSRIAEDYPDVEIEHQYVDSCAMALVSRPSSFDVILTENMFGDILSDEAGAVVGSLGLLASASIGGAVGLFEPVHGSAPDIAGRGIANPLGAILSVAMMFRHSFHLDNEAASIERAVEKTLAEGFRTRDLVEDQSDWRTTFEMGTRVAECVREIKPQKGARAT